MKLEEAIEIKEKHLEGDYSFTLKAWEEADRLSIEALKRLQYLRAPSRCVGFKKLPGETED